MYVTWFCLFEKERRTKRGVGTQEEASFSMLSTVATKLPHVGASFAEASRCEGASFVVGRLAFPSPFISVHSVHTAQKRQARGLLSISTSHGASRIHRTPMTLLVSHRNRFLVILARRTVLFTFFSNIRMHPFFIPHLNGCHRYCGNCSI